jgi:hypothetical protein
MATVNLDTAARLDIVCRKRDSFQLVLDFGTEIPSDGWLMQVREDHGGTIKLDGFLFARSSGDATNSKLTISASAGEMNFDAGLYVYDLQNTDTANNIDGASKVKTYVYGTFKLNDDITG